MSPTWRNPNWDSIILRTLFASCSNWSKTGKKWKIPVKTVITFLFLLFFQKKFVGLTMHVLRSFRPNNSQKQMLLPCLTPNPKWVICLLPAKKHFYRYLTYLSVTSREGGTWQHAILRIFVLQCDCNTYRALIHTPSCLFKHAKCTCTGFTSRNPI